MLSVPSYDVPDFNRFGHCNCHLVHSPRTGSFFTLFPSIRDSGSSLEHVVHLRRQLSGIIPVARFTHLWRRGEQPDVSMRTTRRFL